MVEIRMVDNRIDEVVGKGVTFHMEDMGSHWALIINDPAHKDGWIFNLPRGKVTLYESTALKPWHPIVKPCRQIDREQSTRGWCRRKGNECLPLDWTVDRYSKS